MPKQLITVLGGKRWECPWCGRRSLELYPRGEPWGFISPEGDLTIRTDVPWFRCAGCNRSGTLESLRAQLLAVKTVGRGLFRRRSLPPSRGGKVLT